MRRDSEKVWYKTSDNEGYERRDIQSKSAWWEIREETGPTIDAENNQ